MSNVTGRLRGLLANDPNIRAGDAIGMFPNENPNTVRTALARLRKGKSTRSVPAADPARIVKLRIVGMFTDGLIDAEQMLAMLKIALPAPAAVTGPAPLTGEHQR